MARISSPVTKKMQDLERRYGKPIRVLLAEVYREHGAIGAVARELGISQGALSLWIQHLKGRIVNPGSHLVWEGEGKDREAGRARSMPRYEFSEQPDMLPGLCVVWVLDRAGNVVAEMGGLSHEQAIAYKSGWRAAERVLEVRDGEE